MSQKNQSIFEKNLSCSAGRGDLDAPDFWLISTAQGFQLSCDEVSFSSPSGLEAGDE